MANRKFFSVRVRTNNIGMYKSCGWNDYVKLCEFHFEHGVLNLNGLINCILLDCSLSFVLMGTLDKVLSFGNILLGLGVSSIIGVVSGIVPATLAARMDPVEAIRTA